MKRPLLPLSYAGNWQFLYDTKPRYSINATSLYKGLTSVHNPAVMWSNMLIINSALWTIAASFLVYAVGVAVLTLTWKELVIAALIFAALTLTEILLGALND